MAAGAQRRPELVLVLREALDDDGGDGLVDAEVGAGAFFFFKFFFFFSRVRGRVLVEGRARFRFSFERSARKRKEKKKGEERRRVGEGERELREERGRKRKRKRASVMKTLAGGRQEMSCSLSPCLLPVRSHARRSLAFFPHHRNQWKKTKRTFAACRPPPGSSFP